MTITDDIVKSLRNPTPLYAFAGTADLAAQKLREVPALIERIREQAPDRIEKLRATDPKVVQERVTAQAKETQAKLNDTWADLDLRELRDFRRFGESVQDFALQGVGRAAEYAVKARETYDELAERGKGAMATWRGEAAGGPMGGTSVVEPRSAGKPAPQSRSGSGAKPESMKKPAPARKTTAKKPAERAGHKPADKPAEKAGS